MSATSRRMSNRSTSRRPRSSAILVPLCGSGPIRVEGKIPHAQALLPLRDGILSRIAAHVTEDRLTPQRLVHDVRSVMPPDGILALDNGMYKIWFARNYRTRVANTLLLDNALAAMGVSSIRDDRRPALPEARVIAVCGDGGFMMNSQEPRRPSG